MPPISAKRKIDAVLTVCQDNDAKTIVVTEANKAASRLTGYPVEELKNKKLTDLLPPDLTETVNSMVEFDADGGAQDLASVMRKMFHFAIQKANGDVAPVNLKVFYVVSDGANPCYELLLRDITLIKKLEELREKSVAQHESITDVDSQTGLAGIKTLKENLNFLSAYITGSTSIEVTFAAIQIDKLDKLTSKYGEESKAHLMKQVGEAVRKVSRAEDTVALINDTTIGLILLDCNQEDAHQVLNRYRLRIGSAAVQPDPNKEDSVIHVTSSFGFKEIKPDDTIESLVSVTKENLKKAQQEGGDRVVG